MGDLQPWPPAPAASRRGGGGGLKQQGPRPEEIKSENWLRAESAACDVLRRIQPTAISDQRRQAIVDYVHSLLRSQLGCEVVSFGSVPLKTYLPDGDIDLTALGYPNTEDDLSNDVHSIILYEEQNSEAEFKIKDVQSIHAEVKLVKCIIQNIIVDVSFNQIGGLRTLCFLEQIDRKIGKDHLFKRSIILIKAWCYYESRILGAHHSLISTYALETLVLYVFHLFHRSLNGPLAVLYRFLDFYSKFDWDNYCVSLKGPVSISSLPELVVEPPETNVTDLLFTNKFIKECLDQLSVPGSGLEVDPRIFPKKYLNIVDPLKQNNNLGRSVNKGNFYRIRSAFSYGARKLGHILMLPAESISGELCTFFTNMDRHGSRERPDVQDLHPNSANRTSDHNEVKSTSPALKIENKEWSISGLPSESSIEALAEEIKTVEISDLNKEQLEKIQVDKHLKSQHHGTYGLSRCDNVKLNGFRKGNFISDVCLSGDAKDLASTRFCDSRNLDESFNASSSRIDNGVPYTSFYLENGPENVIDSGNSSVRNVAFSSEKSPDAEGSYKLEPSSSSSWLSKSAGTESVSCAHLTLASYRSSYMPEDSGVTVLSNEERVNDRIPRSGLSDLAGDYQIYLKNLQFACELQDGTTSSYFVPFYPLPSHFQNKHSWNTFQQHALYTTMGANGLVPGTLYSPNSSYYNASMISGNFGTKDFSRTRGTGTYFPNTNSRSYRERHTLGRGKNQITNQYPRFNNSGGAETLQDRNLSEGGNNEQSQQLQSPMFRGDGRGVSSFWDMPESSPKSAFRGSASSNGITYMLGQNLEFGSLGPISIGDERSGNSEAVTSSGQVSGSAIPSSTTKKPSTSTNHERADGGTTMWKKSQLHRVAQSYRLKDEGDFPPLG